MQQALKGSIDFETLEGVVRESSLRIGAQLLQSMLNSATDDIAPSLTQPDGTVFTYAGKREKTFVTVLGDITLKRAYYTEVPTVGTTPVNLYGMPVPSPITRP